MALLKSKRVRSVLAFIISAGLLWMATRGVDFGAAVESAGDFDRGLMLVGLVIWLVGYGLRGLRWLIFLNNLHPVRWYDSFRVLMVGFAMNNVLPLRAGEFIRAFLLHRQVPSIPASSAFATVAGERVFDGIAVVAITILGASSLDLPGWANQAITISALLFAVAFVMFLVLVLYPEYSRKIVRKVTRVLPGKFGHRVDVIFDRFIVGLGVLKSKSSIVNLLIFSLFIWLVEVVFYLLSARAFGIELSFLNACFLMGILNLAVMLPAAPGGIGAFELVTVKSLLLLGVGESLSFSYGVVSHVIQNGSVILVGFYYFWRMGLPKIKQKASPTEKD